MEINGVQMKIGVMMNGIQMKIGVMMNGVQSMGLKIGTIILLAQIVSFLQGLQLQFTI